MALIEPTSLTPYLLALVGLVTSVVTWLVKGQIQTGRDVVEIRTIIKYYVERQTSDALERLDKGNPAPPRIVELARKRIRGKKLTDEESDELFTWLKRTGTGLNLEANSAERSAALQLLTGFKTRDALNKPKKKRWFWQ